MVYEGFGPGATLIINRNINRTIADIKTCFNKCHSKLSVNGCVSFNYQHASVVSLSGVSEEIVLETLFDRDISFNDVETDEDVDIYK